MKQHQIRPTSLLVYADVLENLGERQTIVYKAILDLKSSSNTMIAEHLNLPINCITPRVNELRKDGVVMQDKKDVCPITKKIVLFWRVRRKI